MFIQCFSATPGSFNGELSRLVVAPATRDFGIAQQLLLDLPPLRLAGGSPVNKGRAWQSNEWNQTAQNCSLISFIQVDPVKLGHIGPK